MSDTPALDAASDAQLVAAHMAGDRRALGAIYDRSGDALYDTAAAMMRYRDDAADVIQDVFATTADHLGELRDPDRLRPWLFAILRNEVYRRSGNRRRQVAIDVARSGGEITLTGELTKDPATVEFEQLARLVRGAGAGLDERDQLVIELSLRQGLAGNDLADALGVMPQQCYGLVHRMRQHTQRSLSAYCVARTGRAACETLNEILQDWNDELSTLVTKRVARHVDDCEICRPLRATSAPFALFGAGPAFTAPPGVRERALRAAEHAPGTTQYGFDEPGGFPDVIKYTRRTKIWVILTALALLISIGTMISVLAADDQDTPPAPTGSTTPVSAEAGAIESDTGSTDGASEAGASNHGSGPDRPGTVVTQR